MPRIRDSVIHDRSKLERVTAATAQAPQVLVEALPRTLPSPLMMCSMPPQAATLDQFQRQFYNRSALPQMRMFIPVEE